MATRTEDGFILDALRMRRTKSASYIARKFNLTTGRVVEICDEISRADREKNADMMLHYPQGQYRKTTRQPTTGDKK